jgi:hypothetical protein
MGQPEGRLCTLLNLLIFEESLRIRRRRFIDWESEYGSRSSHELIIDYPK